MITEPHQSQNEVKHVYITHAKFQVHPINNQNFTNQIQTCLTKSSQMAKQQIKSQSNRKWIQKFQKNSHVFSTFTSILMQKSSSIQVQQA